MSLAFAAAFELVLVRRGGAADASRAVLERLLVVLMDPDESPADGDVKLPF